MRERCRHGSPWSSEFAARGPPPADGRRTEKLQFGLLRRTIEIEVGPEMNIAALHFALVTCPDQHGRRLGHYRSAVQFSGTLQQIGGDEGRRLLGRFSGHLNDGKR